MGIQKIPNKFGLKIVLIAGFDTIDASLLLLSSVIALLRCFVRQKVLKSYINLQTIVSESNKRNRCILKTDSRVSRDRLHFFFLNFSHAFTKLSQSLINRSEMLDVHRYVLPSRFPIISSGYSKLSNLFCSHSKNFFPHNNELRVVEYPIQFSGYKLVYCTVQNKRIISNN